MALYTINDTILNPLKEKNIALEKDIQLMTENNIRTLFELEFVSTEFALKNFRIDTLAFDHETNSFVLIEFKRDKSFSIIDQGIAYLALMLNNKADFILEYNEKMHNNLKRDDIDWTQSRILFIAKSFTPYQKGSINFRDLPIELWEVNLYENSIIQYNQILPTETSESIRTISKNPLIESVSKEVKSYTLNDHIDFASEKTKNLYLQLREKIQSLGNNIQEKFLKHYVAFRTTKNFVEIQFQKERLKIHLDISKVNLDDPRNITRDMKNIGHYGTGDTEITLENESNLNYLLTLIEQSYRATIKS